VFVVVGGERLVVILNIDFELFDLAFYFTQAVEQRFVFLWSSYEILMFSLGISF
jgi:hypothetical protein